MTCSHADPLAGLSYVGAHDKAHDLLAEGWNQKWCGECSRWALWVKPETEEVEMKSDHCDLCDTDLQPGYLFLWHKITGPRKIPVHSYTFPLAAIKLVHQFACVECGEKWAATPEGCDHTAPTEDCPHCQGLAEQ
jgi:hypothetical protein